jgi:hypothetical protein
MKDVHKNMIALLIIIVIVAVVTDYYKIGYAYFWVGILFSVTLWMIVSPFKFYDDVS